MPSTPGAVTDQSAPVVTVVRTPACHLCDAALQTLERLRQHAPLTIEVIEVRTDEGARLVAEHRPPMSPLVLLDGKFVSSGRLRTGHLLDLLRNRGVDVPFAAVR
jgi:glutaredoxin